MLFGKKFNEIDEDDINKLVEKQEEESLVLDFKEYTEDNKKEKNAKEIAKDISSMANSEGGLIIYGIKEENSKAKEIKWINSSEDFGERLLNIINTTIVPHITINIYTIISKENNDKCIYLVYIPKDVDSLYCVTKDMDNRFYTRGGVVVTRMSPREIKDRFQLILEKQKKIIEFLEKLKRDYCEASKIDLNDKTYFNINTIPDILNEKIIGNNLKEILNSVELKSLSKNYGSSSIVVRPCYKDNFIMSAYFNSNQEYENKEDYYKDILIVHKNGIIEKFYIDKYYDCIQSYTFIIYLAKFLRFSLAYFNKIQYYGGFKIIVTFRAYKQISFQTYNGDKTKNLQHSIIQEEIRFNQCLDLTEIEIKSELKEFMRKLGSYAGLNLEDFSGILSNLEKKSISEICMD